MATDYAKLKAGGFMLQKQKDVFSMRLRVVGGTVTVEQLQTIRAVAEKYGHGYIHLTSRQGIEIPFIKLEDIDAVKAELDAGGVQLGASGPRVRTVTACQGGRCCPSGRIDALEIATELDKRYYGRTLPHKFKFGVTGCPNNCLKAEENDLGVKGAAEISWNAVNCVRCGLCKKACARRKALDIVDGEVKIDRSRCAKCGKCADVCRKNALTAENGFIVSFGGTFGNDVISGEAFLPVITSREDLWRVTDTTIDYFDKFAEPKERLIHTIRRRGWDEFKSFIRSAFEGKEAQ